ncbi:3-hydroxyacyl-CoA dehydrogenase NAD-binding domain-containing protein [Cupriavidus consociatus]|uniref:3-hydroxyacyl-CoA dehydrogenase NAD-binding domain-containing protein n=1 Tax=Cupriavidus consociatus TaxID=2821357 RepID=UPI001AE3189B|nr:MULTISPECIES: 3-hydroxyacyl-CoA dehydrogenase NAD-binding domain-containing protein [unclassified Cupriavidus]MBP0619382.1 enoyl-CoA hydratase/isomerase family protein [Cupriavidus sp. LEh25]MDK2656030.1 3-hydroxyacyl-CoA dehydrogenase NAD-binding domain-containing protein [Cupriavidus sp. LEh21]
MTAINAVTSLAVDGNIAVLTVDSPPVNALSAGVRAGILQGIERCIADPAVQGIVLACAGKTFIAGADITEFGKPLVPPGLPEVQAAIENSPKPVVAAIHGTALGGGLEVALVCHYRIAARSAKCGLPEVHLGLLPGAGGTQRLPRLVGAERALEMVACGTHVPAPEAAGMGLLDALADDATLRAEAIAFARRIVAEQRPLRKVRDLDDRIAPAGGHGDLFAAFRKANARRFRGFDAPEANIRCIEAAVELPFDEGLRRERELFQALMAGTQSAAQRYVFFASRQVWNVPDIGADVQPIPVAKVGIVGAGTMGGGIAMNFLNAGMPVTIVETTQQALDRGLRTIRANYDNTMKKGRLSAADVEARMALLTPTLDLQQLAEADLVIEAVYENMEVKKELFGRLDRIVRAGAILATNTSALDVDEIAAATSRPEAVIGLHFFSPANVMKLLEVVRGEKTAKPVVRTSMELARKIGKVAALVGVCPGFVGNRMLAQRQREAQKLALEGALPWDIDRVLHDFGFPMGPFAMSDLAGLDLGWVRERSTGSTLREILCEMDRRGQKTGAGYYDYDAQRNARPSPVVEQVIRDFAARQGRTRRAVSDQEILERCVLPMINEGAKILQEGKALRASDIDVIWNNGYGWPVYRGGPMFYADTIGLDKVVRTLRQYEEMLGEEFHPAPLLADLAARGKRFADMQ